MTIEDAVQEQQESVQEQAVFEAESMYNTNQYQPLMDMMEAVNKRNKAVVEGNVQDYMHYTKLLEDENCGDC